MITLIKDQIGDSNCPKRLCLVGILTSAPPLEQWERYNKSRVSDPKKGEGSAAAGCPSVRQPLWLTGRLCGIRNKHCCLYWKLAPAHGINSNHPDLGEILQGFSLRGRQRILCHLRPSEHHSILPHWHPEKKKNQTPPGNLSALQQYHPSGQEHVFLTHPFHGEKCTEVIMLNKQSEIFKATLSKNWIFTAR